MASRQAIPVVLLALLLAGCSAPDAAGDPTPTSVSTTAAPVPTPTVAVARAIPELGAPCWDTAHDAPEMAGDPGRYEAAGISRADKVAVQLGIANARRYTAACLGGDMPDAALAQLVVQVVNASGAAPSGGLREGAPFVHVDLGYAGWRSSVLPWSAGAEQVRLAAGAFGEAWLAQAGCTRETTPGWLHRGFVDNVAYGASTLAGDLDGKDVGALLWRRATAAGDMARPLPEAPGEGNHASMIATMLLMGFADDPTRAVQAYCGAIGSGTTQDRALADAFGITAAEFTPTWAVFRAMSPGFASDAGLVMPPAPSEPACFATVDATQEPSDILIVRTEGAPLQAEQDLRRSLNATWGFVRACINAPELSRFHNLSITVEGLDGAGYNGGGWTMNGDGTGVRVRLDAEHRQFTEGPQEWGSGWGRYQMAAIGATVWLESHNCRPENGQLPAWLREGIIQYVARSQATATGEVTSDAMRAFSWSSAKNGKAVGLPLSTWNEYGSTSWPGDWSYFAMERLVDGAGGPASIADLCAQLGKGTSLSTAFATAFGIRLASIVDDPTWPSGGTA